MFKLARLIALICLCIAMSTPAVAQRRVALVVGNGKYINEAPLANPGNDARDVTAALKRIGFEVRTLLDGDLIAMQSALADFARLADGADLALLYYSGHGIEVDGRNYLIPTSAKLADAGDVEFETVPLELALSAVDRANEVKLVVLDACRNNPFQARMLRRQGKRSIGRGFAAVAPANGTMVAFAAKAGTVADDGPAGGNSPFTRAFLQAVEVPRLDVRLMFGRVRDHVVQATRTQEPFTYGSLGGKEVFLNHGDVASFSTLAPSSLKAGDAAQAWKLVENSRDEWMLEAFVGRYGDTFYGDIAKGRLAEIRQKAGPPKLPDTSPAEKPKQPALASAEKSPRNEIKETPSTITVNDAARQSTATCKRLMDDPIEALAFPIVLLQNRLNEQALAYDFRAACRAAALAHPNDIDLQLALQVTELVFSMFMAPERDQDWNAQIKVALERSSALVKSGNHRAIAIKAVALLFLAELDRGKGSLKSAQALDAEALQLATSASASEWGMAVLAFMRSNPAQPHYNLQEGVKWLKAAAEKGNLNLAGTIGMLLSDGAQFDNPELRLEGKRLIERAVQGQSNFARFLLAGLMAEGKGMPANKEGAFNLFSQFGRDGSPAAQVVAAAALLGKSPLSKNLPRTDTPAASTLLDAAVEKGDSLVALAAADLSTGDKALTWYRRAADGGNPFVMLGVAERYALGKNTPRNQEEAIRLVRQVAETGDAAITLQAAIFVKENAELSAPAGEFDRLFKLAAEKGDHEITFTVAHALAKRGNPEDMAAAAALLSRISQAPSAQLAMRIAELYANDGKLLPQAETEKRRLYLLAAETGDARSAFHVADLLVMGEVFPKNVPEAIRLYRKVAGMDTDAVTSLALAEMYAKGDILPQDPAEASRFYRLAAAKGEVEVALEVARVFGEGRGVYVNQVEATKWLNSAAASGHAEAVLAAAEAFADGKIVPRDAQRAQHFLEQAITIASDNPTILHTAALRLLQGNGVAKNEAEAIRLLHTAADKGYSAALEQLAECYDKGQGTPRSASKAASLALNALKKRGTVPSALYDAYSTTFSVDFRRAVQTELKTSGHYKGQVNGTFAAPVKRALDTYAKP
jgi:uncharacterized protein